MNPKDWFGLLAGLGIRVPTIIEQDEHGSDAELDRQTEKII